MLNEVILTMWMIGLMTHVGDDAVGGVDVKNAVAVVAGREGHHHASILIVDRRDSVPRVQYSDLVSRDRVRFVGQFPSGGAEATPEFQSFVPTLSEPATNSLVDEWVKEQRPHKGVAWIHYPGGSVDIVNLKAKKGRFFRGNDLVRTQCVPAITSFDTTADGDVTMYVEHADGTKTPFPIQGKAFLLVVNEPYPRPSDADVPLHFTNYGMLLKRRYGMVPRHIASVREGEDCGHSKALQEGTTLRELLADLLQIPLPESLAHSQQTLTPQQRSMIDRLLDTRAGEQPACTNTDWP
jgi:hypothetical protein